MNEWFQSLSCVRGRVATFTQHMGTEGRILIQMANRALEHMASYLRHDIAKKLANCRK